ncbi:MAG TPA: hypothetical protein VFT99_10305, partial [Roseiflexaceae bacterium]|nr:hypothetical protein [Roseiflexaceae bacterium]
MTVFLAWLRTLPFTDTIERQQAKLLQAMMLFLIGSTIVGLPISLVSSRRVGSWVGVISYLLILAFMVTALFILQRGKLRMAASIAIIVLALVIGTNVFFAGLSDSETILAALMVPLVLGG